MSHRYQDSDKGSSRSTRDDSRAVKDRHSVGRGYESWERQRTRSRSPRLRASPPAGSSSHSRYSPDRSSRKYSSEKPKYDPEKSERSKHSPGGSKYSSERSRSRDKDYKEEKKVYSSKWENSDSEEEEVPAPPPPPRISKISIGFSKPKVPIKMSLSGPAKATTVMPKPTVASVFNTDDDDDEPEEMPAEAKMRMRNIGRETPTSAGPNSFGKTKQGFCDAKKVFEKNLKQALETAEKPKGMMKFPQTIYRINGP